MKILCTNFAGIHHPECMMYVGLFELLLDKHRIKLEVRVDAKSEATPKLSLSLKLIIPPWL
jgi:hypothetical protein